MYATYNTRPAYLIAIILFIALWIIYNYKKGISTIVKLMNLFVGIFFEVYENGYVQPNYSFVIKTLEKGEIYFNITLDKEIPLNNNILIYKDGKLIKSLDNIEEKNYEVQLVTKPNTLVTITTQSSFSFKDEKNRDISFKIDNLQVK